MARSRKAPTPAGQHILLALLDGEQHGYALMRTVEEQSDGSVRMGPGTLYGTLQRLVEQGLIEETTDREPRDEGERRRYYQLTRDGRAVALEELARLRSLVERFGRHAGPAPA
jgi:DNA-binding PadR family transcriptional regulator